MNINQLGFDCICKLNSPYDNSPIKKWIHYFQQNILCEPLFIL